MATAGATCADRLTSRGMTLVYEYFAAPSDDDAVRVLEFAGWPVRVGSGGAGQPDWDVVDGASIEPTVNLADLEELLTGVDYETIVDNPRAGATLASQDDQGMVITVTDRLQAALADVEDNRLAPLAAEWSHAEEFGGDASPGDLRAFLTDLVGLASRAMVRNERLYCRVRF